MAQRLAFELREGEAPNHYLIRLLDEKQIAALSLGEGFKKPFKLEPLAVVYDEGNGEFVPLSGFDGSTAHGRIAMKILADVYCDVLGQVMARKPSGEQATSEAERGAAFVVLQ